MKKIRAAVKENDRIVINIIDHDKIQYSLVEAKTGRKLNLGDPVKFSLSVKKFFGVNGKTIRELYRFSNWHNPRLKTELDRIWRIIDIQICKKEDTVDKTYSFIYRSAKYDDERTAC